MLPNALGTGYSRTSSIYSPSSRPIATGHDRAPSPFSSQLLTEAHDRVVIRKGLVKIYHDSMEGALSCWLTERNCPYSSVLFDGSETWSSNWANRVVSRVCEMDHAYAASGGLSLRDQQHGKTVLNLAVMAFASQWSQTASIGTTHVPAFGRDLQSTLWHQASQALFQASENASFRVILAGVIFSLTQRPLVWEQSSDQGSEVVTYKERLSRILSHDGPPLALDIALRKLQGHQRKLGDGDYKQWTSMQRQTFGLLYWLAVMFDTLSAAINRRSFTVADADTHLNCDNDEAQVDGATSSLEVDLWGGYFVGAVTTAGDIRMTCVRWPCSYDDAAACLTDAAPVKVLLFRRVAQLQALRYRRTEPQAIETGIEAALEVYNHWNGSYGRFVDDCIAHHEGLPARIQSWYTLLAGHWNLAVLILADLIDELDATNRTLSTGRYSRASIKFTSNLRARATIAVSELGRCSQYVDTELSFSQSPDFHHAVNKAALLTEPWTMVLVRSFGNAGAILAQQLTAQPDPAFQCWSAGPISLRDRLQYCIDALKLLGRKSDMAKQAAQVLQDMATGAQQTAFPEDLCGNFSSFDSFDSFDPFESEPRALADYVY